MQTYKQLEEKYMQNFFSYRSVMEHYFTTLDEVFTILQINKDEYQLRNLMPCLYDIENTTQEVYEYQLEQANHKITELNEMINRHNKVVEEKIDKFKSYL